MKGRTSAWGESIEHTMNMTDLEHRCTRCDTALIVLTMAPIPPMPRIRALNDPALRQRCAAFYALWTCLHLDAPPGPMRGHPSVQRMVVILLIRKDRRTTRQVLGRDVPEQQRGRHTIIETGPGKEHGEPQAQRSDQQMALAPFDFLAAILPALGASHLGGLDRLALDARGTGGGLAPCGHTGAFAQGLDHLGPGPVVAPLRKGVIDGARGQPIMREHVPLAPAPVQRKKRVEDFPHVDRTRVPAAGALLGRRDQRCHDGPLVVCEIGGILLSRLVFFLHTSTLLGW